MGLGGLIKKGFKKLKKWQPLKTVKKVAQFVPGGAAIAGRVEAVIDAVKRRRQEGQSPGDAIAGSAGVVVTTPEQQAKNAGILLAVAGGLLLLFMLSRRK